MQVLGIRCSNKDFTYAVLKGKKLNPKLIHKSCLKYPNGYKKPRSLQWLMQEIEELVSSYEIKKIVLKANEGQRATTAYEDRVEHEAAVTLGGANKGVFAIFKKRKSTIAKDLGQKGRSKYLASLDTSNFPDFEQMNDKEKESILAAWSVLP